MKDALIVGAGISGLSLAYKLAQKSCDLLVIDRQNRVGGNIISNKADGFQWEEGPNSFARSPALLELVVELDLQSQLLLADGNLPRYVYWNKELLAVPMSLMGALQTNLLSWNGKLRALLGAIGFVSNVKQKPQETVAEFFDRHVGAEVTERLVAPFVSGVYAGNPDMLAVNAAFSRVYKLAELGGGLLAGAILQPKTSTPHNANLPKMKTGELGSFKDGLVTLPKAIAAKLGSSVELNTEITHLAQSNRGTYIATVTTLEGVREIEAKTVILTTPAYVSAKLLENIADRASFALGEISYPPVACVVLAYPTTAFKNSLRGFGNLIPRHQGIRTLGTIWGSSLFGNRAPQGWAMLINFIGGATDQEIVNLSAEEIVNEVHQDLCQVLLNQDVAPKVLAVKLWKQAIPQYNLGHLERLQVIENEISKKQGLFLCSNYMDGVSLGDCITRANITALQVSNYLNNNYE